MAALVVIEDNTIMATGNLAILVSAFRAARGLLGEIPGICGMPMPRNTLPMELTPCFYCHLLTTY